MRQSKPRPPLTAEQQALAATCYRLAWREAGRAARRLAGQGEPLDVDEARSVACVGLVKAAQGFDPARGFQFTTYAVACMRRELQTWLRQEARHRERYRNQLEVVSVHDGRCESVLDLSPWEGGRAPEDALTEREEQGEVRALLAAVRERVADWEWDMLMARARGATLQELAAKRGVSKERIRQICLRAIVKARGGEEVDDLEGRLHHECPRRILGVLHVKGVYRHYRSPADGRVLCFHWQTPVPEGLERTAAQGLLEATSPPLDGTERIADNRQRGKGL